MPVVAVGLAAVVAVVARVADHSRHRARVAVAGQVAASLEPRRLALAVAAGRPQGIAVPWLVVAAVGRSSPVQGSPGAVVGLAVVVPSPHWGFAAVAAFAAVVG